MTQPSKAFPDFWNQIYKLDPAVFEDYRAPLIGIDDSLCFFGLIPLPEIEFNPEITPEIHNLQPSFKYLTENILISLRQLLYNRSEMDTVAIWAEKLMRFCEIRYATLKKRAFAKWEERNTVQLNMLHLMAFLLDYYSYTKDLRYLNIILKLFDLNWIIKPNKIS